MDDKTIVYEEVDAKTAFYDSPKTKKVNKTAAQAKAQAKSQSGQKSQKGKSRSKKKSKIGIEYNAPISLTFSLICLGVFIFQHYFLKNLGDFESLSLFTSPTKQGTALAFSASNPLHYLRLVTYVFGHNNWNQLFYSLILVLLLGPNLEITYGKKLLFVMILISSFVSSVIVACFSPVTLWGASGIVYMMIILSTYSAIEKKKLPLSLVFVGIFVLAQNIMISIDEKTVFNTVATLIGGFLGCLFGFLATPVKKSKTK